MKFRINTLIIIIASLFLNSFSLATENEENLIVSSTSYLLKKENLGLSVKLEYGKELPNSKYTNRPDIQLAKEAGYLILLNGEDKDYTDPEFRKTLEFFRNNDYTSFPVTEEGNMFFLIPNSFLNSDETDSFLDGKLTNEYINYILDWDTNEDELETSISKNNTLLTDLSNLGQIQQNLSTEKGNLEIQIDSLTKDIKSLEDQIADIVMPAPGFRSLSGGIGILDSVVNKLKSSKITYKKEKDYYLPAFDEMINDPDEKLLVDIKNKSWVDKGQVSNPFLNPDLVKAIEEINEQEKDALKEIGIDSLKITSGARTPYNQTIQMKTQPVAAGMFTSGHIFGVAVDFAEEAKIKANYDKFKSIVSRHGLHLPPSLKNSDPKHAFLAKFVTDKKYANRVRGKFLNAYNKAMTNERDKQITLKDKISDENSSLNDSIKNLNDLISKLNVDINNLKRQKENLENKKIEKTNELELKKQERAYREHLKDLQNGKNDRESRERIRDFVGEKDKTKDNYWEKHSYGEFQSSDGTKCNAEKYENSRGERWERGYCETKGSPKEGMQKEASKLP
jgi:hypothetical protein